MTKLEKRFVCLNIVVLIICVMTMFHVVSGVNECTKRISDAEALLFALAKDAVSSVVNESTDSGVLRHSPLVNDECPVGQYLVYGRDNKLKCTHFYIW